jgi:hypothetical protein
MFVQILYDYLMTKEELEALTKSIVDKAKAEVKIKYGNKKRHRQ